MAQLLDAQHEWERVKDGTSGAEVALLEHNWMMPNARKQLAGRMQCSRSCNQILEEIMSTDNTIQVTITEKQHRYMSWTSDVLVISSNI